MMQKRENGELCWGSFIWLVRVYVRRSTSLMKVSFYCNYYLMIFLLVRVDFVGWAGITNHICILGAGHFHFFFQHLRNLSHYTNQGWEHYNGAMKSFYHCWMQRNGCVSHMTPSSKIKPIGCLMRKTGKGEHLFKNVDNDNGDLVATLN